MHTRGTRTHARTHARNARTHAHFHLTSTPPGSGEKHTMELAAGLTETEVVAKVLMAARDPAEDTTPASGGDAADAAVSAAATAAPPLPAAAAGAAPHVRAAPSIRGAATASASAQQPLR